MTGDGDGAGAGAGDGDRGDVNVDDDGNEADAADDGDDGDGDGDFDGDDLKLGYLIGFGLQPLRSCWLILAGLVGWGFPCSALAWQAFRVVS